jgi:SanA protein
MAETPAAPAPRPWWTRLRRVLPLLAFLLLVAVVAGNAVVILSTKGDIVGGPAGAPSKPIAIVLGTRVYQTGAVSIDLRGRLALALELYQHHRAERIVVSGAFTPEIGYDEPGVMAGWLRTRGVAPEDIILDRGGHRTAATMANAAASGFRDVLVCTQAYHLPRALYLARHAGLRAVGVVATTQANGLSDFAKNFIREGLARAEIVLEVALRGVRA